MPARNQIRGPLAWVLCLALLFDGCAPRVTAPPTPEMPRSISKPLLEALRQPYNELFDEAPGLEFSAAQIERMRRYLSQSEEACKRKFTNEAREHDKAASAAEDELERKTRELSDNARKELHCRIQTERILKTNAEMLSRQGIPVGYQNRQAKLELIEKWPARLREIRAEIESKAYLNRPHADVRDIGFRAVGRGQEDDIKEGQKAIEEMKRTTLLPPEVDDRQVQDYVTNLALKIAARSDLRIPVKTVVLNSSEINAFALPGGYLYVNAGLLEAADDEAQLAGVLAHEIAHAAARHGHQLMRKATMAAIFFQAAQLAAVLLTGGLSLGAYYALQYGFYGLGLVLDLNLLGVSREFEMEADQLGIQYAWNAGYDTSGFIRFFDKMANREGYVQGISWFRTHPPFYQRMAESKREILFLGKKDEAIVQTTAFEEMKRLLAPVARRAKEREERKPSLKLPEGECPTPKLETEPGARLESLCGIPIG